jgi:hypothetical protein
MLREHAVKLTVATGGLEGLPPHMDLNIGNQLSPPMNLALDAAGFEADLRLFGRPVRRVRVSWASVVRIAPLYPPPGGGSPQPMAA